jgi:heat shock protein HslJ
MKHLIWIMLVVFACSGTDNAEPLADASFTGTYWKLVSIADEPITHPAKNRLIHIVFYEEDSRISGYAGCNNVIGNYVLNDPDRISMLAASTKMFCEDSMDVEQKFLTVLTEADHYKIDGNQLSITTFNKVVAIFERVDEP